MRRLLALALIATLPIACRSSGSGGAATGDSRPFGAFVAQRLVVTPLHAVRIASDLQWGDVGPRADLQRSLDSVVAAVFAERGVRAWVFSDALVQSHQRNPTYATDPHGLAAEPLRAAGLSAGARLPEPLASQLRTIVALHDARYVLAPIELRFDRMPSGVGRAALRVVLVDARQAEARWVGDLRGDTASRFSPVLTASVASRLADLFVSP